MSEESKQKVLAHYNGDAGLAWDGESALIVRSSTAEEISERYPMNGGMVSASVCEDEAWDDAASNLPTPASQPAPATRQHELTKLPGVGWGSWKCFPCGRIFRAKPSKKDVCIPQPAPVPAAPIIHQALIKSGPLGWWAEWPNGLAMTGYCGSEEEARVALEIFAKETAAIAALNPCASIVVKNKSHAKGREFWAHVEGVAAQVRNTPVEETPPPTPAEMRWEPAASPEQRFVERNGEVWDNLERGFWIRKPAACCEICGRGMADGVNLSRRNATGVRGIWRCDAHHCAESLANAKATQDIVDALSAPPEAKGEQR